MFTNLTPCYQFTDSTAYIVDDVLTFEEGTIVKVYVPALMSEIHKDAVSAENIESLGSQNQIFLNTSSCPSLPGTLTTLNYVSGEICHELVMDKANEDLYNNYLADPMNAPLITHVPRNSSLLAGTEVDVKSYTGTIRNLYVF